MGTPIIKDGKLLIIDGKLALSADCCCDDFDCCACGDCCFSTDSWVDIASGGFTYGGTDPNIQNYVSRANALTRVFHEADCTAPGFFVAHSSVFAMANELAGTFGRVTVFAQKDCATGKWTVVYGCFFSESATDFSTQFEYGKLLWQADMTGDCCGASWAADDGTDQNEDPLPGVTVGGSGSLTVGNNGCCKNGEGACQKGSGGCDGTCN